MLYLHSSAFDGRMPHDPRISLMPPPIPYRIGFGHDVHRLIIGRPLILAGVHVPHEYGLLGHSDADVLTHALCDAILGACGLGDIGRHFPDSDPRYKGISSLVLLEKVMVMTHEAGYELENADLTLVADRPRISPFVERMRETIARVCGVSASQVNIKGTTTEGLGFTGAGEGMAAHAVVLLVAGG